MNLKVIFTISILFLLPVWSCTKKAETIDLHYNETGCANPWSISDANPAGINNNDPDYQNKVKAYLQQQNINPKTISITNDGPASGCFSCLCTTGRRINITINYTENTRALTIGFYAGN